MPRYLVPCLLGVIVLGGCTTLRETEPGQTAREQLLLSTAADQASAQIAPNLPAGNRIYIDTSNFGSSGEYQNLYAISTIKAALLKQGFALANGPDDADTILDVSSGALSIDKTEHLFGIPSADIPIPLAGPLSTPELAIWKSKERTGVAKFLLTFYDAKTGTLQDASDPIYGFSHYDKSSILFYGRTRSNLQPDAVEKRRKESE
ncbi:DUF6655 family protein [Salinisphaera aquimarina]|uniref:DUF6655 family protein n=1 Tax=Salinisphaera aquimarina TaxID=2094031 RepID=A0ABV7ETH4_9GAMM